jgi:hypothetical protein
MAINQVQKKHKNGQAQTPNITYDNPTVAGNLLISSIVCGGTSMNTPPAGWKAFPLDDNDPDLVAIYYKIADGTETDVEWGLGDDLYFGCAIFEFSGLSSTPADRHRAKGDTATAQITVTQNAENASPDSLCFSVGVAWSDNLNWSVSSGWDEQESGSQANWLNDWYGTRITSAIELSSITLSQDKGDVGMQAAMSIFSAVPPAPSSSTAVWDGSAWKSGLMKAWDGTEWV